MVEPPPGQGPDGTGRPADWAPHAWNRAQRATPLDQLDQASPRRRLVRLARRTLRPARAQARKAKLQARKAKLLVRPLRPPLHTPEQIARYSRVQDRTLFTGNALAARCRHVLNFDTLTVNEEVDNDWWFCRTEFLDHFFREVAPDSSFVLFSHNSDRPVGRRFAWYLRRKSLVAWFAANAGFRDPRLFAIPLGIANPFWAHGNAQALRAVQRAEIAKTRLFEVSFSIATNPRERLRCLAETGLELQPPCSFPDYLERLASSCFSVSPEGEGLDTHRTWEALHLRAIPIVTRSVLTEQHPDVPMVVLDGWSQFREIDFGPELYAELWGDWSPAELELDVYLKRVGRILDDVRASPAR